MSKYEYGETIKDGITVQTFSDGQQLYFKLRDLDNVYKGYLERYISTLDIINIDPHEVERHQIKNITRVISEKTIETTFKQLSDVRKNIRGETISKKIERVQSLVRYAKMNFIRANPIKRQKCTDRSICMKCKYAYFISTGRSTKPSFQWCNYLEMTGQCRPHNEYKCFGFAER